MPYETRPTACTGAENTASIHAGGAVVAATSPAKTAVEARNPQGYIQASVGDPTKVKTTIATTPIAPSAEAIRRDGRQAEIASTAPPSISSARASDRKYAATGSSAPITTADSAIRPHTIAIRPTFLGATRQIASRAS